MFQLRGSDKAFNLCALFAMCLFLPFIAVARNTEWLWSGEATGTSFTVKARMVTEGAVARLVVGEGLPSPPFFYSNLDTALLASNNRVVSLTITGLEPNKVYFYGVESGATPLASEDYGRVKTFPDGQASFTLALGSCAWTGSNSSTFDSIRFQLPLFFCHMGDMHYENIGINDVNLFRNAFTQVLTSPRQFAAYQSFPIAYMWDDHDYGPNNSDSTNPARLAARLTYQEFVPHYPLVAGNGDVPLYQAFTVGRVRFIMTDSRSMRSPYLDPDTPSKTMLGVVQKDWFKQELSRARDSSALVVWVNTLPWIGMTGDDGWYAYTYERAEIADFIATQGITNICMVSGDAHMVAADNGSNSDYSSSDCSGFPVFHAAPLDRTPAIKGGPYSEGAVGGTNQFGFMNVTDTGDSIRVDWSGRNIIGQELVHYSFIRPTDWSKSMCACCVGTSGNVDCSADEIADIADVTRLIDYLFITFSPLCCVSEANTNSSPIGTVDIGDLTTLIDHLFLTFVSLGSCP